MSGPSNSFAEGRALKGRKTKMPLRWKLDAIEFLAGIVIFLAVWAVRFWKMGSNKTRK
jgi:hypothetical protein